MAIEDFLKNCNSCGKCQRVCLFLTKYGRPEEILNSSGDIIFECTNCKACTIVCPLKLDPAEAIYQKKGLIIASGELSQRLRQTLKTVRAYAMRGHRVPLSYYGQAETVFWPGCGLAGVSPQIVRQTVRHLTECLQTKVGLVLDCCFDPCWQIADEETVKQAFLDITQRLNRADIKTIITGCVNCTKVLSLYLRDLSVKHFLEVLPIESFQFNNRNNTFKLHHPCPSFRYEQMQSRARLITREYAENRLPECCGFGGELHHFNRALSMRFADRAVSKDKSTSMLTYCMGCKQRFMNRGVKAYHILETLKGAELIEIPPSGLKKYTNRFMLASMARINLKKLAALFILIALIALTAYLRAEGYISVDGFMAFIKEQPVLAPLLFMIFYALGPSLFIPSLPMTLGAGFIWGPLWGSVFSITGATIGATLPFLISRYIMADTIKRRFSIDKWLALNERVNRHGWKAVAFARLMPILPFPVLNYVFGMTPISLFHYVWASFVFMLPACIAYTAFGSSMGELIMKGSITGLIIGIAIASIAMIIPFVIKRYFVNRDAKNSQ